MTMKIKSGVTNEWSTLGVMPHWEFVMFVVARETLANYEEC